MMAAQEALPRLRVFIDWLRKASEFQIKSDIFESLCVILREEDRFELSDGEVKNLCWQVGESLLELRRRKLGN
jgi:hypothetical protein